MPADLRRGFRLAAALRGFPSPRWGERRKWGTPVSTGCARAWRTSLHPWLHSEAPPGPGICGRIDRLVYELYELREEEIGIVEEATK